MTLDPQFWHIRYSVKTTALFSNIEEARQHAVYNESLKTFCGRNAQEYWQLDASGEAHVTCDRCRKALAKAKEAA
jgi:hypothetical protein